MISFDDFDEKNSPRPNDNDFSKILDRAVSRRGFLKSGAAFGVSAFVAGGTSATAMADSATAAAMSKTMGFAAGVKLGCGVNAPSLYFQFK
jgi:secreted PhoX family phosphatase